MKYELYRGNVLLSVVIHEIDDFPSHKGLFQPSEGYKPVASLFEQEWRLLESNEMDKWQKVRDEIDDPIIELRPIAGSEQTIANPLIHIDGTEVWWR